MVMKCISKVCDINKLRNLYPWTEIIILLYKEITHSKPCIKMFAYKICMMVKSEKNNPVEGLKINTMEIHLFV